MEGNIALPRSVWVAGLLYLVLVAGCGTEETATRRDATPPAGPYEYADLDGYGQWVGNAEFGQVWSPYVTQDWEPFAHGYWAWTDRGWMWVAYEPFGWIVYHYGSWAYDPALGWIWIPGDQWSPARVRWRTWGNYVAWSPLPPAVVGGPPPLMMREERWTTVSVENFSRDDVGTYRMRDVTIRSGDRGSVERPPDITVVDRTAPRGVSRIPIQTVPVTEGRRTLERVRLPASEENRVAANRQTVEDRYLRRSPGVNRGATPSPMQTPPAANPPSVGRTPAATPAPPAPATPARTPQPVTPPPQPAQPAAPRAPAGARPANRNAGTNRTNGAARQRKEPAKTTGKKEDQAKKKKEAGKGERKEGERRDSRTQEGR